MIGKVIEGRYEGASVKKLPDKNILYIQTEDGTKIALSKSNVISIDDVTDQYPSYGRKVMMVMWNDFETSIFQLGSNPSPTSNEKSTSHPDSIKPKTSAKKKNPFGKMLIGLFITIFFVVGLFVALKIFSRKEPKTEAVETTSQVAETKEYAEVETIVSETTIATASQIEYADQEFLEAIEISIENRNQIVNSNSNEDNAKQLQNFVYTELAVIGKFKDSIFLDEELQAFALKYINGLTLQEEALKLQYSEKQIKWQEGLVERYEVLCALREKYGVFQNDTSFVSTYELSLPSQRKRLNAIKEIERDLTDQLDGVTLQYESANTYSARYTNNTNYDFDVNFYFWYYDQSGVRIDEYSTYFTNIISGKQTKFQFWCPANGKTFDFEWEILPHVS